MDGATQPTGVQPQGPSRNSFTFILLVTWMIFMLGGSGEDVNVRRDLEIALGRMDHQIANYSAWLNGTESNFTVNPQLPALTPLLDYILPPNHALNPRRHSYYRNLTGFIRGEIEVYNLSDQHLNTPWARFAEPFVGSLNATETQENIGIWNISDTSRLTANMKQSSISITNDSYFYRGTMDLSNEEEVDPVKYEMNGVHLVDTGAFYAFVQPLDNRSDIRQLSALVPDHNRNTTAHAVLPELEERRRRLKALLSSGQIIESHSTQLSTGVKNGYCTYVFRGQLLPIPAPKHLLQEFEDEIMHPTGRRTVNVQPAELEGVLVSHDCGILIKMDKGINLRSDTFWRKSITYSAVAFCVYFVIAYALANQIEWTRTPASISRVSRWPFAIQAVGDSYAFVMHMTLGVMSNSRASLPLIAPGFVAAVLFLVLEARYAILTHRIQAPEDAAAPIAVRAPPPTPATAAAAAAINRRQSAASAEQAVVASTLPPEAARTHRLSRRVINFISNPESRVWLFGLVFIIVLIQLMITSRLFLAFLFGLHSFWVPQIVRNVKKGTRRALRKRYVFTATICRAFFPLYTLACPENVFFFKPNSWVWVLVAWMFLQVGVLFGQEYFGTAFFLPKSWEYVKTYDYHAVLPLPDPETPDHAQALGDCSVCLEPIIRQPLDITSFTKDKDLSAGLLGASSRSYSIAPCQHFFHTACLERWLGVKNICPVCRRHLPPL